MNRFGTIFSLTSFGESHGPAIGGVIDGMPAGIAIDLQEVQRQLSRRRPGQSAVTTSRQEADKVDILSGMLDGVTTGTPIGFTVANTAHQSDDYSEMENKFRPSHATTHTISNMAYATTAEEDARPHAKPWLVSLQAHSQDRHLPL